MKFQFRQKCGAKCFLVGRAIRSDNCSINIFFHEEKEQKKLKVFQLVGGIPLAKLYQYLFHEEKEQKN